MGRLSPGTGTAKSSGLQAMKPAAILVNTSRGREYSAGASGAAPFTCGESSSVAGQIQGEVEEWGWLKAAAGRGGSGPMWQSFPIYVCPVRFKTE